MSDYLMWPAGLNTADLRLKTRRPKLSMYGPPRGSAESQALFGASKYSATAQQMANRAQFKFSGAGRYGRTRMHHSRRLGMRRRPRIRGGRGGYFDNMFNFGSISQGTGHAGNLSAGGGDYSVPGMGTVDNAIVGAGFSSAGIPQFAPHQSTGVFSKVEFLQSIYAPSVAGAFQNTILPLNPGLQQTFPWLALVAPQFEEYEFLQLMFYWRPMVSDFNSGTGQTGEIIMVTQYNPSDPPFIDTLRAKSYDMAMSCKASLSMNHGVECDPTKNSGAAGKYVRVGPLPDSGVGSDLKQYDLGNLNVIVTGTPTEYSGQLLGELWVAYTVALRKPKLPISTGDTILRDYFSCSQVKTETVDLAGTVYPTFNMSQWNSAPIAYGAQNRINNVGQGLIFNADDTNANWTYELPPWYSGDMRITLTILNGILIPLDVAGPQTEAGQIIKLTAPFEVVLTNCTSITDLATMSGDNPPPLNWPAGYVTTDGVQAPQFTTQLITNTVGSGWTNYSGTFTNQLVCTIDCRIPAGGAKVAIVWRNAGGIPPFANVLRMTGWQLDATEYNTAFNGQGGLGPVQVVSQAGVPLPNPFQYQAFAVPGGSNSGP